MTERPLTCPEHQMGEKEPKIVESYLSSGGVVRDWITFELPIERSPKRLQLFSGYLCSQVVAWDLDTSSEPQRVHAALAEHEVARRQVEVEALEAKASVARTLQVYRDQLAALDERAHAAKAILDETAAIGEGLLRIQQLAVAIEAHDEG